MQVKTMALAGVLLMASGLLHAQFDFKLAGRPVQVHSFASQGFAYSNGNNFLTMKTSQGSFSMTDIGINASTQITDKFRVGAQIYDRNIGKLGNWRPELDWAVADYRFKDWFGVRGGKVKTVMGLYNDTQDMEFLHTWALVPQSLYALDRRGDMIAHIGGDIYGTVGLKKLGSLSYTVYGGQRPNDANGGYLYAMSTSSKVNGPGGIPRMVPVPDKMAESYSGPMYGADVKWTTPVNGLTVGVSYVNFDITTKGFWRSNNKVYTMTTQKDHMPGYYLTYSLGNFRFDGEYRREIKVTTENKANGLLAAASPKDLRGGYVAAAYRFTKFLEVGAYHSRYYYQYGLIHSDPNNHIFDQAISARIDLRSYLDLKVEGHFIDGIITSNSTNRGFYVIANPDGLKPQTNLLVVRMGFHM